MVANTRQLHKQILARKIQQCLLTIPSLQLRDQNKMTPYELLDLALSLNNRIDNHWTLFITVHLALIGGIIYVDRPLIRNEKIAAILIYSGFALVNYLMMRSQAQFLAVIFSQVAEIKNNVCCTNNHVITYVNQLHQYDSAGIMLSSIKIAHLVMYLILVLSVLFDKTYATKTKN